jgi:eight-cysteine-cluster-containing protein
MKKELIGIVLILFLTGLIATQEEGNLRNDVVVSNQNHISAVNSSNDETPEELAEHRTFFCGTSTKGTCEGDKDCIVGGCSNSVCQSKSEEPAITTCSYSECQNAEKYNAECSCVDKKCKWSKPNAEEIKNFTVEKNRLRPENKTEKECPKNCTCKGSTVKCELKNGREMTVTAGNSGNIMVQIKGENMSTKVTLYKSEDGKVYMIKGNVTKEVKMLPDQVKERIRERLQKYLENENITLNENGTYNYAGDKEAKLFFLFPIKVRILAEVDAETGEVKNVKVPWWAFLAKDKEQAQLVGSSCGTVTPGYNDECCQTKGYDVWNSATGECEFSN